MSARVEADLFLRRAVAQEKAVAAAKQWLGRKVRAALSQRERHRKRMLVYVASALPFLMATGEKVRVAAGLKQEAVLFLHAAAARQEATRRRKRVALQAQTFAFQWLKVVATDAEFGVEIGEAVPAAAAAATTMTISSGVAVDYNGGDNNTDADKTDADNNQLSSSSSSSSSSSFHKHRLACRQHLTHTTIPSVRASLPSRQRASQRLAVLVVVARRRRGMQRLTLAKQGSSHTTQQQQAHQQLSVLREQALTADTNFVKAWKKAAASARKRKSVVTAAAAAAAAATTTTTAVAAETAAAAVSTAESVVTAVKEGSGGGETRGGQRGNEIFEAAAVLARRKVWRSELSKIFRLLVVTKTSGSGGRGGSKGRSGTQQLQLDEAGRTLLCQESPLFAATFQEREPVNHQNGRYSGDSDDGHHYGGGQLDGKDNDGRVESDDDDDKDDDVDGVNNAPVLMGFDEFEAWADRAVAECYRQRAAAKEEGGGEGGGGGAASGSSTASSPMSAKAWSAMSSSPLRPKSSSSSLSSSSSSSSRPTSAYSSSPSTPPTKPSPSTPSIATGGGAFSSSSSSSNRVPSAAQSPKCPPLKELFGLETRCLLTLLQIYQNKASKDIQKSFASPPPPPPSAAVGVNTISGVPLNAGVGVKVCTASGSGNDGGDGDLSVASFLGFGISTDDDSDDDDDDSGDDEADDGSDDDTDDDGTDDAVDNVKKGNGEGNTSTSGAEFVSSQQQEEPMPVTEAEVKTDAKDVAAKPETKAEEEDEKEKSGKEEGEKEAAVSAAAAAEEEVRKQIEDERREELTLGLVRGEALPPTAQVSFDGSLPLGLKLKQSKEVPQLLCCKGFKRGESSTSSSSSSINRHLGLEGEGGEEGSMGGGISLTTGAVSVGEDDGGGQGEGGGGEDDKDLSGSSSRDLSGSSSSSLVLLPAEASGVISRGMLLVRANSTPLWGLSFPEQSQVLRQGILSAQQAGGGEGGGGSGGGGTPLVLSFALPPSVALKEELRDTESNSNSEVALTITLGAGDGEAR
jgi:hypothetical protein